MRQNQSKQQQEVYSVIFNPTSRFLDLYLDELNKGVDLRNTFDEYIGHPVTRFVEGEYYEDDNGDYLQVCYIEDREDGKYAKCRLNGEEKGYFLIQQDFENDVEIIQLTGTKHRPVFSAIMWIKEI
jgi:hypothetical protein